MSKRKAVFLGNGFTRVLKDIMNRRARQDGFANFIAVKRRE